MELKCKVQNYDWGKKGSESMVAKLLKNADEHFIVDENQRYAELWMGTHVNAPSVLKDTDETLSAFIAQHPEYLGEPVVKMFGNNLPFLFKVLSVNKALSIQAHPTKKHAEELHTKFPDIYKDPNHKPELAIAITPFEVLCGFRPVSEIRKFAKALPELSTLVDQTIVDDIDFLKKSFRTVLTCCKANMSKIIGNLLEHLKNLNKSERNEYMADLVERLNFQFPNDNGILMVYFLNYLKLEPLQAIYLAANEPHAYLSGDCIENMACSDNVVRAGLTPKFIDVETLCSMLTYHSEPVQNKVLIPIQEDNHTRLYKPPVEDFAIAEIWLEENLISYTTRQRKSASIFIVIKGKAKTKTKNLKPGMCLFLPANEVLEISEIEDQYLLLYQAFANVQ